MTTDKTALRALAEAATPGPWRVDQNTNVMASGGLVAFPGIAAGFDQKANAAFIAAANPAAILALLDELEAAKRDAERIDWLESSISMHGFCHIEYGDFRYYARQGFKSVRDTIDEAMKGTK